MLKITIDEKTKVARVEFTAEIDMAHSLRTEKVGEHYDVLDAAGKLRGRWATQEEAESAKLEGDTIKHAPAGEKYCMTEHDIHAHAVTEAQRLFASATSAHGVTDEQLAEELEKKRKELETHRVNRPQVKMTNVTLPAGLKELPS